MNFLQNDHAMTAIYVAAGAAVLWIVAQVLNDAAPQESRLRAVSQRRQELAHDAKQNSGRRAKEKLKEKKKRIGLMKRVVTAMKLQKKDHRGESELRIKLLRAGYRSRDALAVFMFLKVASVCGLGFVVFSLTALGGAFKAKAALSVLGVLVGLIFGWVLPDILLKNMAQARRNAVRKAMPDALDLMVICAEAGLSLDSTFDRVSREIAGAYPELAEEFGLTSVELGLLPERSKALQNLADRVELQGILSLINTLIQTERYGTPLAQALRVLATEMRDERMMRAEEKAARLPAIMTVPMIIFILPTLFIVIIGPAAIKVMATMAATK